MAYEGFTGGGIITPATNGTSSSASSTFTRGSLNYENPFLDMTSTFIPTRIKSLLRYISAFVLGDGLVSQCVTKMAEYPITKFIYNDEYDAQIKDDKTEKYWKNILEKKLNLSRVLKQTGMDYYSYGNSLVSISYPFKRELQCPKCKQWHSAEAIKSKFKNYQFSAKCITPKCNYSGTMIAKDVNTKDLNINIIHWDLININIKYNSLTDQHFYYYTIPLDIKAAIRRGDKDIVKGTRLEIIEAIRKNKQLKIMDDNIFHLKRPGPQYIIPSERGWGIPVVMSVMKDIFHNKILKKGNEMIAFDHIVPLRILFPQGVGEVSPHLTTNLSGWRTNVENELIKFRKDSNYIAIVPFPIGMQSFGGDARILMVTPEIKATEDSIITGIGIIPEIIRGGASWSGSNVSLRVVENTFLNHRDDMHRLIEFIVDKLAVFYDKEKINVKMSDFKMADDLQKKQLMVQSAQGSPSEALVSRTTVTKELGFDPDEEMKNKEKELKDILKMKIDEAEGTAEAQGAAAVINALFNTDAEAEATKRRESHEKEMQMDRDSEMQQSKEQSAPAVEQEVNQITMNQKISLPNLILLLTQRFAHLATSNREEFRIRMISLKNSMPNLFYEVFNNLKEMNIIEADLAPREEKIPEEMVGQVPVHDQGGITAEGPPSPVETGASVNTINTLPEARPPRSAANSSI